jgi:hypothetical protein
MQRSFVIFIFRILWFVENGLATRVGGRARSLFLCSSLKASIPRPPGRFFLQPTSLS